jgi:predicted NAD/FAD-binding protein
MTGFNQARPSVAVVGAGIAGMSAAWLLSQKFDVTLYEAEERPGGHSHTVDAPCGGGSVPVDMGFIVYNEPGYPNLTALFDHLQAPTRATDMSFAVSLDDGALEYASTSLRGLFAQPRNLVSPRFWSMLRDILRFYRHAPTHACALDGRATSLGDYLGAHRYGCAFQDDHLLPQAAAIWSAPVGRIRDYPADAFIRFCDNHGLLKVFGRPVWRTVVGGSRAYVARLTARYAEDLMLDCPVRSVRRALDGVNVRDGRGGLRRFDHLVLACHADQALRLLEDPSPVERRLLGAFGYTRNQAVLHSDPGLMPTRRSVWSSWNYVGRRGGQGAERELCVTYWMNRLQHLQGDRQYFVTLNPVRPPQPGTLIRSEVYDHPLFDAAAMSAQRDLWSLQGRRSTWFCGAYFGSGFHEDALQSGLAVAEALGGLRRPWRVRNENGRIHLGLPATALEAAG